MGTFQETKHSSDITDLNASPDDLLDDENPEGEKHGVKLPLVLLLITMLISGGISVFYTWPHVRHANETNTQLEQAEAQKVTKESELALVIENNKKPRVLTPEEKAALQLLPNVLDVPNLIRLLEQVSFLNSDSDVDDTFLRSFNIGLPSGAGTYQTSELTTSFSSSRYSLIDLLKKFEASAERIFNVKSISITLTNREGSDTTALFGNPQTDVEYQVLLAKRQSFLLTATEAIQLADMQETLETEYRTLLRKRNRSESDDLRIQNLQSELDNTQTEAQYSMSIETYIDSLPTVAKKK